MIIPTDAQLDALSQATGARLLASRQMLVTAESCTGGWIAKAVTDVAGSSAWFDCGMAVYSYEAKQAMLGVNPHTLEVHGAVSRETVVEMVSGALVHSGATIAVAVTGIAGPGGGSAKKPVGLVVFARALRGQDPDDYFTQRVQFDATDRAAIRQAATLFALDLLQPDRDSLRPSEDIDLPAP